MDPRKRLGKRRARRAARVRAKVSGVRTRPRMSVFRSNRSISVQLIDDAAGHTLVSASSRELGSAKGKKKTHAAEAVGALLAKKALALGIKSAVFDRGAYLYHGRVKAVVEGARKAGFHI